MVYFLCKAYDSDRQNCYFALSLPVRGAWVEIAVDGYVLTSDFGRSPCGERGLKLGRCVSPGASCVCRSPCGERGLKFLMDSEKQTFYMSLPVRGAWVEIYPTA